MSFSIRPTADIVVPDSEKFDLTKPTTSNRPNDIDLTVVKESESRSRPGETLDSSNVNSEDLVHNNNRLSPVLSEQSIFLVDNELLVYDKDNDNANRVEVDIVYELQ